MKKFAEGLYNFGLVVWNTLSVLVGLGILLALAVYLSRHVTCVNIFDKVCLVY